MKLKLLNFRCYEEKTFDFDDNGLILISAISGRGKSTILMAIQFVLYGSGTKLQTYGKTSCSVEFEYQDFKIIRTKRPNRLILNDIYEDEIAQKIINKKFGDTFNVTSYISQSALNSFIIMNPTEKLEFLEKFAFKDIDILKIKNKIKNFISIRNEELNKTITQIDILKNVLNEMDKPEEIKFPFKCKKEDQEKITKNEGIKCKNADIIIKKSQNTILKTQKEINDLEIYKNYIETKEDNLESILNKLEKLSLEEKDILYEGDEELENYKIQLENIILKRDVINYENQYNSDFAKLEEMKKLEIKKLEEDLYKNNIEFNKITHAYSEEKIKENLDDNIKLLKDVQKIIFLKNQEEYSLSLKEYKEKLQINKEKLYIYNTDIEKKKETLNILKKQGKVYSCPSCKCMLNFKEEKLYYIETNNDINKINENELQKEINQIKKEISQLEINILNSENKIKQKEKLDLQIQKIFDQYEDLDDQDLDEQYIQDDIDMFQKLYSQYLKNIENDKIIKNKLSIEDFSSSYKMFEKVVLRNKEILEKLKLKYKDISIELSEEKLREIINKEENNKQELKKIKKRKDTLKEENQKYVIQIEKIKDEHINKYGSIREEKDLDLIVNENKEKISEAKNKKEKAEQNIQKIEKYNNYIEEKKKYDSFLEKIKIFEEKEIEDKKKYLASIMFKEKVLEAESIAIQNIIDSINIHSQIYLEYFFPDNPMNVKLLAFKETKKNNKPQINIEIEHKGMEADLSSLSGGELSRIVLAFTLTLNEMFNSPFLLLDECTSSLDQETTTIVFDAIKENFKSKIIIVVAHQVVEGVFDKIIKL